MKENYELIDNEERHQYEFHIERYVPRIEYIKNKDGVENTYKVKPEKKGWGNLSHPH